MPRMLKGYHNPQYPNACLQTLACKDCDLVGCRDCLTYDVLGEGTTNMAKFLGRPVTVGIACKVCKKMKISDYTGLRIK